MLDVTPAGMTGRTVAVMGDVLSGRRRGLLAALAFAGPSVIVSIAYIDPGNFATNIQASAGFGYALLWVVAAANGVAMLFQALSAKLGIATGRNLAELSRDCFPPAAVYAMWVMSEAASMATDLAEFLGGAIGLALIARIPLIAGMAITGVVTYALLLCQRRGFRPLELIVGGLVGTIGLCYLIELTIVDVNWGAAARGTLFPTVPSVDALTIAVGIVGATVMPHALYLHSGLTQARALTRNDRERGRLIHFSNVEVVVALSLAGLINMAMLVMAAAAFHAGHRDVAQIETAYHTLTPLLGNVAGAAFLVSLTASGLSSSVVGTMAGQLIMQGFVGFRIPVWLRRLVTMVPAFVVIAVGIDATRALVASQVVLSFALPIPMLALVFFTSRRDVMGRFVNRRGTTVAAIAATLLVLSMNAVLLAQTLR